MKRSSLASDHFENIVNGFISDYSHEVSTNQRQLGFNFNVLAEQCGNIVENSHTNLLMRLLQYRNKYGYVFLEDFISLAGFNISIENKDVLFKTEYPVGSDSGKKGRIDGIIYQNGNFAIIIENKINHAGNQDKQIIAMESLENHLIDKENGIVKLLDPPFEKSKLEPGYIKGYLPGVRENGGQYTHECCSCGQFLANMLEIKPK